jgi:diguanylate cyclase (GGDEF)-like protein
MEEAVARSRTSGDLVAVVSIDVVGFAAVNRRFGHAVGDEVLRRVSDRLRRVARAGDTVARVEGDEFIVLMDGFFDPDLPRYTAEHIAGVLTQPFDIDGQAVEVSAGIGIATSLTSKEAGDLLHHADVAMRRAKASGTSHEVFDPERHDAAPARNELVASLREAVAAGDFLVLYQPIQELATGVVTNVEALVRWRHPERGMISPADFIPLAEDSGLIVPIGRFVLEQACREASRWAERYGSAAPGISVNLSACQLREPAFVDHVAEILAGTGLAPGALTLEITETVLVEDLDRAVAVLEQLHELGVELAIDDFGTGYNSIAYLQEFPVDVLKIDKVFVDRVGDGNGDEALIAGILGLARNLGMRTVAEGIETQPQLQVLRRLGCAEGQGFLFSRPIDALAIAEYLVPRNPVLWASSDDVVVAQAEIATASEASTR